MTVTVLFPRARPVGPGPSITSRDRPGRPRAIEKERTQRHARRSQSQRALHHCLSEARRHTGLSGFARNWYHYYYYIADMKC